jgi:hypothetical protein
MLDHRPALALESRHAEPATAVLTAQMAVHSVLKVAVLLGALAACIDTLCRRLAHTTPDRDNVSLHTQDSAQIVRRKDGGAERVVGPPCQENGAYISPSLCSLARFRRRLRLG